MAQAGAHYEIFLRKHEKAEWTLISALDDRACAMAEAEAAFKGHPRGDVRVMKEQPRGDGSYSSVLVKGFGGRPDEPGPKAGAVQSGPLACSSPDEVFGALGREAIGRVLRPWLNRNCALPVELVHRPDLVERLECSHNDLQGAMQKIASARAGGQGVHEVLRALQALVTKATDKLLKDQKSGALPRYREDCFAQIAAQIAQESRAHFRILALAADGLKTAHGWTGKAERLAEWSESLSSLNPSAGRALGREAIDEFCAELVEGAPRVSQLVGAREDAAAELEALADAFIACVKPGGARASGPIGRIALAQPLDRAKRAIAQRIFLELRSSRRLKPADYEGEIRFLRWLADRLASVQGPDAPIDDIVEAFAHRSMRLLAEDALGEFLTGKCPFECVRALLLLSENVVGEGAKRKLAQFVRASLFGPAGEDRALDRSLPALKRLNDLSDLQRRALQCGLMKDDRLAIGDRCERLAQTILDQERVLEAIAERAAPEVSRAAALLTLAGRGDLPSGKCAERALAAAQALLRSPQAREHLRCETTRAEIAELVVAAQSKLLVNAR